VKFSSIVIVLLAAAGCSGNTEPRPAPGRGPGVATRPSDVPPVYALLGQRERIELTSEQIAALDSIGIWVAEANRELLESLREHGLDSPRMVASAPIDPDRIAPEGRAILVELGENNTAAARGVEGVLTTAQRDRICELFGAEEGMERSRDSAQPGGERVSGQAADSRVSRRYRWPWCAPGVEQGNAS